MYDRREKYYVIMSENRGNLKFLLFIDVRGLYESSFF